MKISNALMGAGVALAFCWASAAGAATTLYDNLSATSGGAAFVSTNALAPLGESFSTGAAASDLTDVKLLLEAILPRDGGSFTVELLSSGPLNAPGSVISTLATIQDSSLTSNLQTVDISLSSPILLSADTRYWIELGGAPTSAKWSFDNFNTGTGVANQFSYFGGVVIANSIFTPYQMQVNVSAVVPEPATWAMMILGLGLAGAALRRRGAPAAA